MRYSMKITTTPSPLLLLSSLRAVLLFQYCPGTRNFRRGVLAQNLGSTVFVCCRGTDSILNASVSCGQGSHSEVGLNCRHLTSILPIPNFATSGELLAMGITYNSTLKRGLSPQSTNIHQFTNTGQVRLGLKSCEFLKYHYGRWGTLIQS